MLRQPWWHGVQDVRVQTEIRSILDLWSWETKLVGHEIVITGGYTGMVAVVLPASWQCDRIDSLLGQREKKAPSVQGHFQSREEKGEWHWLLTHTVLYRLIIGWDRSCLICLLQSKVDCPSRKRGCHLRTNPRTRGWACEKKVRQSRG